MKKEDAIRKIQALKRMTKDNGASEAEALVALEKANKLLIDYNLSLSDVDIDRSRCVEKAYNLGTTRKVPPSVDIAGAVGKLTGTKGILLEIPNPKGKPFKALAFFGLEHDVDIALFMFATIDEAMTREYKRFFKHYKYTDEYKNRKRFHINAIKSSFMTGMLIRLHQRIIELYREQEQQYQQAKGQELIVLKNAVVDEEWAEKFNDIKEFKRQGEKPKSNTALQAGFQAGDNVSLNRAIQSEEKGALK